jgi:hypothetical protein
MKNLDLFNLIKENTIRASIPNITYFYLFGWEQYINTDYIKSQYECDLVKAKEIQQNLYNLGLLAVRNDGKYISTDKLKHLFPINFFGYSFNDACDNVFGITMYAYPLKIERFLRCRVAWSSRI